MYRMTVGEIADHYRDVCSVLTSQGFDNDQRAALIGKSTSTMKHYGGDGDKLHARLIPAEDLDRLRQKAIDLYWGAAADPYRVEQGDAAKAAGDHSFITPTYIALDFTGRACVRHPHPIYAREIADMAWGSVIDTTATPHDFPLDPEADLRSQWRRLVAEIRITAGVSMSEGAVELMCDAAGACRYSFWRVGVEHQRWRLQPTKRMIAALHAMGDD
ncbi:hypothetical protein E0H39_29545 [Rhizobium leguminosarum bv. viciae]|uniref:hypothetical protein n=1 Tax=Rhizobium leguminosarum TaxID=384 RepID=UPI00103FA196|nr:hypothetical protein [Rhizobium leguminosarum]TBY57964.1 hypothetical protein E0H39_29545 [Rhizobium leguminosarum bv. viciae]